MFDAILTLVQDEIRRLWCHRWLGLACGLAILVVGTLYILSLAHTYDAWAQVYVDKQTPVSEATRSVSLGDGFSTQVVEKTLLNDQNLERLIRETNPAAAQMTRAQMAKAVERLRSQIRISSDADGFVEFHYIDTDPVRGAQMAKRLMDEFIATNVSRNRSELVKAEAFLDNQIAGYKTLLADAQARIDTVRRSHAGLPAVPLTGNSSFASTALADSPGAIADSDTEEVVVSSRARTGGRAQSAKAAAAAERVATLEAKLDQLKSLYTDEYPDVISTRRQLDDAIAAQRVEANLRPSITADAAAPGVPVRRVIRRPRVVPVLPPGAAAEWSDAVRNADVLKANYQQLIARREATRMSLAVFGSDTSGRFQVTRAPTVPTIPVGPHRRLYFGVVVVASVIGGLAAAYLRAALRGIMVSPRELELACQLPVIGTVSWEPAWSTVRRRGRLAGFGRDVPRLPRPRVLARLRGRKLVGEL